MPLVQEKAVHLTWQICTFGRFSCECVRGTLVVTATGTIRHISVWIFEHHREKVMSVRLLNSIRVQSLQDAQATFRRLSNTGAFFQFPSFGCCPDSQSNNSRPLIPVDIGGFPAVSRKYGERSQKANARPVTDLKLKGMT